VSLIAAAWGLWPRSAVQATRPQNVLLITVDTLRADALGAYGNAAAATPWIDRLAGAGLRFDNAHAHAVVTLPSHASILTGRLPNEHGIRDNAGFRVAPTEETLATRLKAQGFRTGAFVSGFPLDSRFGLARGFDVYDDSFVDAIPRPSFLEQERAGTETVAAAARWLQSQSGNRWFCWIHLYDPHFPYAAPAPFDKRFAGNPYAGEVAATDAALSTILKPILGAGAASQTAVILTADHGESLGEHREATHGIFAYEATLKVPLIVHYPAGVKPGVTARAVSHIDIAPTVLRLLGMPALPNTRGHSLVDDAGNPPGADEIVYFEALSGSLNRGWAPLTGVISGGLKYIDLPMPELYDLKADAAEARNLADSRATDVEVRRALLRSFPQGAPRPSTETPEVRERLRSLGYVTASAGKTQDGAGEDPKNAIGTESALQEIANLYVSGARADALMRCRSFVAQHPDMRVALLQLANLERESGNMPEAIAALRRALELRPADSEAATLLAASLTTANRAAEGVAVLQPYAASADADVQVLTTLALAEARSSHFPEARAALDRARGADPANAMVLVTAGTIELMAGRRAEARTAFESALTVNARTARAHSSLAALAVEEGHHDEALAHWRQAISIDPSESERLMAVALSLARQGRTADARPYVQLFADLAPASRYAADIARAREWLDSQRR
jgi:Flp pilus assembly protein TadD